MDAESPKGRTLSVKKRWAARSKPPSRLGFVKLGPGAWPTPRYALQGSADRGRPREAAELGREGCVLRLPAGSVPSGTLCSHGGSSFPQHRWSSLQTSQHSERVTLGPLSGTTQLAGRIELWGLLVPPATWPGLQSPLFVGIAASCSYFLRDALAFSLGFHKFCINNFIPT